MDTGIMPRKQRGSLMASTSPARESLRQSKKLLAEGIGEEESRRQHAVKTRRRRYYRFYRAATPSMEEEISRWNGVLLGQGRFYRGRGRR